MLNRQPLTLVIPQDGHRAPCIPALQRNCHLLLQGPAGLNEALQVGAALQACCRQPLPRAYRQHAGRRMNLLRRRRAGSGQPRCGGAVAGSLQCSLAGWGGTVAGGWPRKVLLC